MLGAGGRDPGEDLLEEGGEEAAAAEHQPQVTGQVQTIGYPPPATIIRIRFG